MNNAPKVEGIISDRDILIAVITNILGVLTLTLTRIIAQETESVDGWLTILLGGLIVCFVSFFLAKIVFTFPNESFFSITSYLLSKPVAIVLTLIFSIQYIVISASHVREIGQLAHQYLFTRTPLEVVSLTFLLVMAYGVSGSRAAIFRLNTLFFPILMGGILLVIVLPLKLVRLEDLLPLFQTDFKSYVKATYLSITCFLGFEIVLFYTAFVKKPKDTPKMTTTGVLITVLLNMVLYIICIGTFGNSVMRKLFLPAFDLSRTVEIPGGFFERFDFVLFVLWTIIYFTTALMAFDITILTLMMIFTKVKKFTFILILCPIIFYLAMIPNSYLELITINRYIGLFFSIYIMIVTILLGVAYKVKGGKQCG